jgi:predicted ATPase
VGTAPRNGPFVGRGAELAELRAGLAAAADGVGGLLLLSGPAGIGKTRTVEEVTAGASAVVWGRCVDDPGAPPLWPWRRIMRALPAVGAAVADSLTEVDRLDGRGGDPQAARFRLVAAAADSLIDAAAPDTLVVVLEDLHWADETTLRLLHHLAAELHRSRLLVIGTYRDPAGPDGGRLADALPELLRQPGTRAMPLPPLSEDEVHAYLAATGAPLDAAAAHRRSGGNPLYLRAIIWTTGPTAAGGDDPGPALGHLVRATLRALPPAVVDLLDAAAVLGEEIDPGLLAAVTERPGREVTGGLDAAVRAGVLAAVPDVPGLRRFAHAVVRDAVYADLAPTAREELHRRSAVALERAAGDDPAAADLAAGSPTRCPSCCASPGPARCRYRR